MTHVLYNSLSDNGKGRTHAEELKNILEDDELEFIDIIGKSTLGLVRAADAKDMVILVGGDGTINYLINEIGNEELGRDVFYHPSGTGNDFMADVKEKAGDAPILLNPYLKNLPTVEINGNKRFFFNGVGFGIDGYCCEVADKIREKNPKKEINYPGIAIKGLLFHFKARNATVTVDGNVHSFKKVWIAPSMNGRFYGGGMMVAPNQDRLASNKKLSVVLMYGSGRIKTLVVFPGIFQGKHIKHKEMVEILTGKKITVEFDTPCALQIDGETVLDVKSYSVFL